PAPRPGAGPRAAAESLLAGGGVLVDGAARPKSHRLRGGEEVVFEPPVGPQPLRGEPIELPIAFEDEHLLVVDKPAGIVVHPGAGRTGGTLVQGLLGRVAGGPAERP